MGRKAAGSGASGCMGLAVKGITATDHVAGNAAEYLPAVFANIKAHIRARLPL